MTDTRTEAGCATGYASRAYAATLGHIGTPLTLPRSGVHLLARPIPGSDWFDLAAPYPLLRCTDWDAFATDLDALDDHVSLVAVVDPFSTPAVEVLERVFPDLHRPWKDHAVVLDGARPTPSAHHRRNLRRATVDVDEVVDVDGFAPDWCRLYAALGARHELSAPARFAERDLVDQLGLEDVRTWAARIDGVVVGAVVAVVDGDDAWYHLGAADPAGLDARAMYGLFDRMIADLVSDGIRRLDLGAGAGAGPSSDATGLDRFKRGWTEAVAPTWLVGRLLRADVCDQLTGGRPAPFFPPYRSAP